MRFKGVIFDLDGTLLNTIEDLADSCNRQLAQRGYPVHPVNAYRYFVGQGMRNLVRQALPDTEAAAAEIDDFTRDFIGDYAEHCFDKTRPYEGIVELLEQLRRENMKMAVLSNKSDAEAQRVVERFFAQDLFVAVAGQKDSIAAKPDPAGAESILAAMELKPEETAFVGDSWVDMRTATNSGCFPLGVLWGFRERKELADNGAKALAAEPRELYRILTG